MNILSSSIQGLGDSYASTVAGNAVTKLPDAETQYRSGMIIHNASETYAVWIDIVNDGASAPTISSTAKLFVINPNATLTLMVGRGVDVYAQNNTGAATTSAVVVREFRL